VNRVRDRAAPRLLLLACIALVALAAAAAASAAAPAPDAHDRALAKQLGTQVAALSKLYAVTDHSDARLNAELKGCKGLGKTPGQSFAVVFSMLPVLLVEGVNQLRPQLLQLRKTIAPMRPDWGIFRRWLAAQQEGLDAMLALDNHGKKIDYCAAAKVMLAKNAKDADVRAVLGVSLAQIGSLFSTTSPAAKAGAVVKKLNPQVRAFLLAAGVPRGVAVKLTK
jgi:hypothetical protein